MRSKIFLSFILMLFMANVSASFKTLAKDEGFKMQQSTSNCILNIASKYFAFGSNVGIVYSTSRNTTNHVLSKNSYNVITSTVMSEMRWTIFMKNGKTYDDGRSKVRSITLIISQIIHIHQIAVRSHRENPQLHYNAEN